MDKKMAFESTFGLRLAGCCWDANFVLAPAFFPQGSQQ
jgi:hypothetical protein